MAGRIDYDEFVGTFAYDKIVDLSATSVALILSATTFVSSRYNWQRNGQNLNDTDWNEIDNIIALAEAEIMSSLVGMIFPHVMSTVSIFKMLPCDGATHLRADYPLLYDAIDPVYIVSGTQFRVPDMRDRTPVATGNNYNVDDSGGADTVALSVAQMPAHTHSSIPHTHSSIPHTHLAGYPTPGINTIGPGVPDPLTVGNPPIPTSTSPAASTINNADVTINSTGDNEAHENRMPYRAVNFAIVAG